MGKKKRIETLRRKNKRFLLLNISDKKLNLGLKQKYLVLKKRNAAYYQTVFG